MHSQGNVSHLCHSDDYGDDTNHASIDNENTIDMEHRQNALDDSNHDVNHVSKKPKTDQLDRDNNNTTHKDPHPDPKVLLDDTWKQKKKSVVATRQHFCKMVAMDMKRTTNDIGINAMSYSEGQLRCTMTQSMMKN